MRTPDYGCGITNTVYKLTYQSIFLERSV